MPCFQNVHSILDNNVNNNNNNNFIHLYTASIDASIFLCGLHIMPYYPRPLDLYDNHNWHLYPSSTKFRLLPCFGEHEGFPAQKFESSERPHRGSNPGFSGAKFLVVDQLIQWSRSANLTSCWKNICGNLVDCRLFARRLASRINSDKGNA